MSSIGRCWQLTPKQRQYIESMTRQLGLGRYWSDGVRYVFGGSMPRVFYDPDADDSQEVSHVIETLQRRLILQRIEDKAKGRGGVSRGERNAPKKPNNWRAAATLHASAASAPGRPGEL